jgi:EAL domain-containing protein (putative c-di-GMP-specific phosphodiesterase class I)
MQVIAEGIETEEQALQLINPDCAFGKGFFYSKPTRARHAEAILENVPPLNTLPDFTNLNFDSIN